MSVSRESTLAGVGTLHLSVETAELQDDDSYVIHGIALGEGDITVGQSGTKKLWPAEELREAAATLEGQELVRDHQNDTEGRIGKVTEAEYLEDVGVVYEAEIASHYDEIAKDIEAGLMEVSVRAYHAPENELEEDEETGALRVHDVLFDNLSVVGDGASPSNTAEPGSIDDFEDKYGSIEASACFQSGGSTAVLSRSEAVLEADEQLADRDVTADDLAMDVEDTPSEGDNKAIPDDDLYEDGDSARSRSDEIGCTGAHKVDNGGETMWAPCSGRRKYHDAVDEDSEQSQTDDCTDCDVDTEALADVPGTFSADGTVYAVAPDEHNDDSTDHAEDAKYPMTSCTGDDSVESAWGLRNNGDYTISEDTIAKRIKDAAEAMGCDPGVVGMDEFGESSEPEDSEDSELADSEEEPEESDVSESTDDESELGYGKSEMGDMDLSSDDVYMDQAEAMKRARELDLHNIHSHRIYMPGSSMQEYKDAVSEKGAHGDDESGEMGDDYGEDYESEDDSSMGVEGGGPNRWKEGDWIHWLATPWKIGKVVHNPKDEPFVMAEVFLKKDGEMKTTHHTETAGVDDIKRYTKMSENSKHGEEYEDGEDDEAEMGMSADEFDSPCWDGYEMVGMKSKNGEQVPKCVPVESNADGESDSSTVATTIDSPERSGGETTLEHTHMIQFESENIDEAVDECEDPVVVEKEELQDVADQAERAESVESELGELSEKLDEQDDATEIVDQFEEEELELIESEDTEATVVEAELADAVEDVQDIYAEELADHYPGMTAERLGEKFGPLELREMIDEHGEAELSKEIEETEPEPEGGTADEDELADKAGESDEADEEELREAYAEKLADQGWDKQAEKVRSGELAIERDEDDE